MSIAPSASSSMNMKVAATRSELLNFKYPVVGSESVVLVLNV